MKNDGSQKKMRLSPHHQGRQENAFFSRNSRVMITRLLLFLMLAVFLLLRNFCLCRTDIFWSDPILVNGEAVESNAVSNWAFFNDGSLQYEDNELSWYSDMETVHAVEGIDINLPFADRDTYAYTKECIIALVDTGVDITHPALQGGLWKNKGEIPGDGIDNDGNGYIDDTDGWNFYKDSHVMYNSRSSTEDAHGTHLAGTMVANDDSFVGIAGGVDAVRLMPIKTVGGINQTGTVENLIRGIRYAEQNGAAICNISLGFAKWNDEVYQVMKDSNMLFVVVAGNGEADTHGSGFGLETTPRYPACYALNNVIVVANIKCDGKLHYSSNYSKSYVDLAAPGTMIYSTSTHKSGYETMTGTSMAAPMVSAAAALVYASHEDWDICQVKQALLESCTKLNTLHGVVKSGGMLNVAGALEYAGVEAESEKPLEMQTPAVSDGIQSGQVILDTQVPAVDEAESGDSGTDKKKKEETALMKKSAPAFVKVKNIKWHRSGKNKNRLTFKVRGTKKADGICLRIVRKKKNKKTVLKKYITTGNTAWKKVKLKITDSKGQILSVKIRLYKRVRNKQGKRVKKCFGIGYSYQKKN